MSELASTQVLADLQFKPFPHQRAVHALRLVTRFLVLVWHRRAGKTVFAVLELLLAALICKDPMGRYGYIAPLLKQSKAIAWDYLKHYAQKVPGAIINESELQVTLPNGVRIRLFGADNPDSFRGLYFNGVVLDEPADMRPNIWGEILVPALADKQGWALFIGTPKGINLFSEVFYRAQKTDGWATDVRRIRETGVIPVDEQERARVEMSPSQWAQEMECDFSASVDNVLLNLADALEATRRTMQRRDYIDEPKVLGVDVARFGDDKTVLSPRQGKVAFQQRVFSNQDTMQVVGQVTLFLDTWHADAVFVDVIGIGAGVYDRLKQLGRVRVFPVDSAARAVQDKLYKNKRIEMWATMAKWVREGGCIPDDPDLLSQLPAPTYRFDNDNRMLLESKADLKARGLPSPDKADALAFTFAAPVVKSADSATLHGGGGFVIPDAYKPFGG